MSRNRAHRGESYTERLRRFQINEPDEAILTLLNSINNFFNNEISITTYQNPPQTSLMFLGIHAVALTISETFFGFRGYNGYRSYLEEFVDGEQVHTKFSEIAPILHRFRNTVAHKWLNAVGHEIDYDYNSQFGWYHAGGKTIINPNIYLEYYLKAFGAQGKLWEFNTFLDRQQKEDVKIRIITQFRRSR